MWNLAPNGSYSATSDWMEIRSRAPEVDWGWAKVVWNRKHVPRWSFIQWMATLGRLSTKDRLIAWGVSTDRACVLCYGGLESHWLLICKCQYAALVWNGIRSKCERHGGATELSSELQWGIQNFSKSVISVFFHLSLAATVYYLWPESKSRIYSSDQ